MGVPRKAYPRAAPWCPSRGSPTTHRHPKYYARFIVAGISLAVFLYLVLLLVLPFVIGPWALVAAFAIALPFALHLHRGHRFLGISFAVVLYVGILLAIPGALWPVALLAGLVLAVAYGVRLDREHPVVRRAPLYNPLPERSPFGSRRVDAFERTVTGLFVMTALVIGLIVAGEVLAWVYLQTVDAAALALVGFAFVQVGNAILFGLYDQARLPGLQLDYYSTVDTTDDH